MDQRRQRLYRTSAIVLKRQDFGEADRILTLFTPERGKLRVIAKGVRKTTSRKSGHVELFTYSNLLIAKGRNLDIVTQAEMIRPFLGLRQELPRHYLRLLHLLNWSTSLPRKMMRIGRCLTCC